MTTSIKPLFDIETTEAIINQKSHHSAEIYNGVRFEEKKQFPVFAFSKKGAATKAAQVFEKKHHFCQVDFSTAKRKLSKLNHYRLKAIIERIDQQGHQDRPLTKTSFITSEWTSRSFDINHELILEVALKLRKEGQQIITSNEMVFSFLRSKDIRCAFYKDKFHVLDSGAQHVFIGTKRGENLTVRMLQSLYMGHKIRIALV